MKKSIIILAAAFLLMGMRQPGTALNGSVKHDLENGIRLRSEVRHNNIRILDINFKDYASERIKQFLIECGYTLEEVEITEGMNPASKMKFDFIFWQAESSEFLNMHLDNVFQVLRSDGVLMLRIVSRVDRDFVERTASELNLEVKKEGLTYVIKRKFENYELFQAVAQELAAMMQMGASA